ncbi:enoyl-[acyl-carrier-protein] reductase FabI [Siculibacillus lacustris]|uniref:Enoyl-[acyl-carrier-protein] reductase [NADH] n=1 Tax=Siculibacillus lacustris TaxID=1549641 RepID=A0A4Q9VLI2_9HYPH|nr:enoyl-ACP reductase FabI [Siculibacillus lacustris]TBW36104.1 enoyl-[acyl-carrier-protein] reductase FabI [Siculibacillus lacustris]
MLDTVTVLPQALAALAPSLAGKKGLVVGIANDQSIAWGCAKAYRAIGADLAITYLNEKADRFVRPLGEELGAELILQADVTKPGEIEAVFAEIEAKWGRLDFLLHAIAFAPMADLHGRVVDCSRDGFMLAMDVSCHSLIRMAKLAEPLMQEGGAIQTVSYLGAEKVVDNYNLMGPVKAALESVTRYLAAELGPQGIRVNTLSPGPLKTRAASGIGNFDDLISKVIERTPTHQLTSIDEVGALSAFLMTDLARSVNGELVHIDGGYNMMA